MAGRRISIFVYLLSVFLFGLGYLAMLPPFEGFDEQAHYSSIRQIADTQTIPHLGSSFIDQAYNHYQGPEHYSDLVPPFDTGPVYSKFFLQPDWIERYRSTYREAPSTEPFRPGDGINWQAQHPPLYYLLMVPMVEAGKHFSFVTQFFLLRLVSFLLALGGVALGLFAFDCSGESQITKDQAQIGFFLYPIILPMFFPEFTRLGNDALCIFLVGAVAYLLTLWRRDESNLKMALMIGGALGMGLLTKAFFLPITAALAAFLSHRLWRDKGDVALFQRRRLGLLCMFYPAVLLGGGWYLRQLALGGDFSGGVDSIILAQNGGLVEGLKEHFSLHGFAHGLLSTLFTVSWAGTWSQAYWPLSLLVPLVALALGVFGAFLWQLRRRQAADFAWLPVWVLAFFSACLFYHVLVGLAIDGIGQTPGWYVHILMPLTAPAFGIGLCSLWHKPRFKPFLISLLIYAVAFQIITLWGQFALFTGCAVKGNDKHYAFPGHAFCFDQVGLLVDRLAVIGWPYLAALGFGGGSVCGAILAWRIFRSLRATPPSEI